MSGVRSWPCKGVIDITEVGHAETYSLRVASYYSPRRLEWLFLICAISLVSVSCNWFREFDFARGARMTGGNPEIGRRVLAQRSCISCHTIPGVPKADGNSAPSLAHWAGRRDFLDRFPNTPENLIKWLSNPSHMKPGTKMPQLNVTEKESRDMAAYLFSIN